MGMRNTGSQRQKPLDIIITIIIIIIAPLMIRYMFYMICKLLLFFLHFTQHHLSFLGNRVVIYFWFKTNFFSLIRLLQPLIPHPPKKSWNLTRDFQFPAAISPNNPGLPGYMGLLPFMGTTRNKMKEKSHKTNSKCMVLSPYVKSTFCSV